MSLKNILRLLITKNWSDKIRVADLVKAGKVECLPDVSFHRLSISHQTEGAIAGLVKDFAAISHAGCYAEALSEGAGGAVDEVQPWCRVALKVGVDFPQVHEVGNGKESGLSPSGVEDGRRMTLGQNEPVVVNALWLVHVIPETEFIHLFLA